MLAFTKMHGLGNDFIVVQGPLEISAEEVARYCNRHYGIGADGFVIVSAAGDNSVRMQYWDADGTSENMCGNGLRCCVRFAVENQLVHPGDIAVQTDSGLLRARWDGFNAHLIEVQIGRARVDERPTISQGREFYTLSIGIQHAVTFVENFQALQLAEIGPKVQADENIAPKTNVDFVEQLAPGKLRIRVWECGAGETLSCGTGMVASSVIASQFKGGVLPTEVEMAGGKMTVWQDNDGYFRLRGPAEVVFKGVIAEHQPAAPKRQVTRTVI